MKSIHANKELKRQEITAQHKRQLTFMFHILLKIEMHIKVIRHSLENESKKDDMTIDNLKKYLYCLKKLQIINFLLFGQTNKTLTFSIWSLSYKILMLIY